MPVVAYCVLLHHEADHGAKRAANIEGLHAARALNLHGAGTSRDLIGAVQQHAHAGGADGMAPANQAPAHVHRTAAASVDGAVSDRLPAHARRRQPEVVQRHIFRGGEAVMGFNAAQVLHPVDSGAAPGVFQGLPHMGKHIGRILAEGQLVFQTQHGIAVPPA